jgi:hypothetical protein
MSKDLVVKLSTCPVYKKKLRGKLALYDHEDRSIYVDPATFKGKHLRATMFHELAHHVLSTLGYDDVYGSDWAELLVTQLENHLLPAWDEAQDVMELK